MAVRVDPPTSPPSPRPEPLPALLTVEEAAEHLRIGRTKAYAMAREWRQTEGRSGLPVVDFGHLLRVPRHKLETMLGADLGAPPAALASPEPLATEGVPTELSVPPASPVAQPAAVPSEDHPRRRRARTDDRSSNQLNLFGPTA